MGGKQSQESTNSSYSSNETPPDQGQMVVGSRQEQQQADGRTSLFQSFISGSSSQESSHMPFHDHDRRMSVERDSASVSATPIFDRHVHLDGASMSNTRQDRPRLDQDLGVSHCLHHQDREESSHGMHPDRSHHRRHDRSNERDRHHERRSHGRRARRYVYSGGELDSSDAMGNHMEFDFSWSTLNERLRALQLRRENEESRSNGSTHHRHGRSHGSGSRSRSHRQLSSVPGASSLLFMRGSGRSKLYDHSDLCVITLNDPISYHNTLMFEETFACLCGRKDNVGKVCVCFKWGRRNAWNVIYRNISIILIIVLGMECIIDAFSFIYCLFPLFIVVILAIPCPICRQEISSSEMEEHMIICMTKPRVKFNGRSSYRGIH